MKENTLPSLPERLLPFFEKCARDLPWRKQRTPYAVLVSEIMLQQTRVDTVIAYFDRFMTELPTVQDLAAAPEEKLLLLWEGLGYYRRVRNLQKAAQMIMADFGGVFPTEVKDLLKLPGVGAYTAGAIASIAFGRPAPAVDGNVLRVISRITASGWNAENAADALQKQYPAGRCSDFTESLMELGATVCLPNGAPHCADCPVRDICKSADNGWQNWPVKAEKKPRKVEYLTVFILQNNGKTAHRRRPESGLLSGLWELPNESGTQTPEYAGKYGRVTGVKKARHIFTHVEWQMTVYLIEAAQQSPEFIWAEPGTLPLPTAFRKLLPR